MKYDLIALDLDGTTLTPQVEITEETKKAIRLAQAKGMRVVVSTGRICGEAAEFGRLMGADDLMVTSGGATISSIHDMQCLMRISMRWESSVKAAAALERVGLSTMIYQDTNLLVTKYDEMEFARKKNEGYLSSKVVVDSVAQYLADNKVVIDKIFCKSLNKNMLAHARMMLSRVPDIRIMSSADDNIEVVSPAADKGTALSMLCKMYGTSLDRAAAIGDSENDLEMLSAVKMPIAMGNARDDVKALCKYITDTNANDGVAKAIYWLLDM